MNREPQVSAAAVAPLPFSIMAKPSGARCNLACDYCFYLEKEALYRPASAMSEEVLERYVRTYIEAQPSDRVTFAWQGGEPTLLGIDFYRRAVALQRRYADGRTIENAFQTNGVLLDDAWCAFFRENDFLVGLSLDGPRTLHDRYRVNKGGRGSHRQVLHSLETLQKHGVEYNTLTVLHRDNADDPLRLYRYLKGVGGRYLQFIPIVERRGLGEPECGLSLVTPEYDDEAEVTDWSLTPAQYAHFLTQVFDEWVRRDVGTISVQIFDSALSSWIGQGAGLCVFDPTCGRALALEHNGDLYPCDHFVYPQHRLGNIMEDDLRGLVDGERQVAFGRAKADLPAQCGECDVRFTCNGGCPKHRFAVAATGETGHNYFCESYRTFFRHAAPFMRFMASRYLTGRATTDVMAWARVRDRGFPGHRIGRNDPCPCGSGRKFKKCCGTRRDRG